MSKSSRRTARTGTGPTGRAGSAGNAAERRTSTSPTGTQRAGRRERVRVYDKPSFLERNRNRLLVLAGIVAIALVATFAFLSATQPSYACSTEWQPSPTTSPAPGSSPRLGYVEPDMGRSHNVASPQRYTYCPPASGTHLNRVGQGPIEAQVYGPGGYAPPMGWIHNLEHGGLVVVYNCSSGVQTNACTDAGQAQFKQFVADFPPSPVCSLPKGIVGPVIARFDQMAYPYAAIIWGRVLPLQTFDTQQILEFFKTEGERTNPERQPGCPAPDSSASPSAAAPSASSGPSGSGAPASSAPAASPAASPSAS